MNEKGKALCIPCSPSKSFKFSDFPTTSTADTRTENLAPVLKFQIRITSGTQPKHIKNDYRRRLHGGIKWVKGNLGKCK